MKNLILLMALLAAGSAMAQQDNDPNIFIITTDGFRWQEVFNGADPALINDPAFVDDTALIRQLYWDSSVTERRKKLMPFFWNVIARQGQLYGNRKLDNKVNVGNIYKISYPGYNELLTGYPDLKPVLNTPTLNSNISVLEYLNQQPAYKDKVVAFTSWYIFPFLLNSQRNPMLINAGYKRLNEDSTDVTGLVQDTLDPHTHTRYDMLTYLTARDYIRKHHPKVVFISFGETDDYAHQGRYDRYLQQAAEVDRMIGQLWYDLQTDPFYRNNTSLVISTDHGRGSRPGAWSRHNGLIRGSGDIWLALLGKGISAGGEMQTHEKIMQSQIAATIAMLAGKIFVADHRIGRAMVLK